MVMSLIESLTKIKNAVYGREVREAVHDGVFRANQIVDKADTKADETQIRQDKIEDQFDAVQRAATETADWGGEIIVASDGEATLSKRLERDAEELHKKIGDYVTVEQFGASHDLENDSMQAFIDAHNYALANNLEIRASGSYMVRVPSDNFKLLFKRANYDGMRLRVFTGGHNDFLFEKVSEEQVGAPELVDAFNSKDITHVDWSNYKDHYIQATSQDINEYERMGANSALIKQTDFGFVDQKGIYKGTLRGTYTTGLTSIYAVPLDKNISVRNAYIKVIDDVEPIIADDNLAYRLFGFKIDYVDGIDFSATVDTTQLSKIRGLISTLSSRGVYNLNLEKSSVYGHHWYRDGVADSSYVYDLNRCVAVTIDKIKSNNLEMDWGIFGGNHLVDVILKDSDINRFDVHYGLTNLTVENTKITHKGITIGRGWGKIYIRNSVFDKVNQMISLRGDYASNFDGEIEVVDSEIINAPDSEKCYVVTGNLSQGASYDARVGGKSLSVVNCKSDRRLYALGLLGSKTGISSNLKLPDKMYFERMENFRLLYTDKPALDIFSPQKVDVVCERVDFKCVNIEGVMVAGSTAGTNDTYYSNLLEFNIEISNSKGVGLRVLPFPVNYEIKNSDITAIRTWVGSLGMRGAIKIDSSSFNLISDDLTHEVSTSGSVASLSVDLSNLKVGKQRKTDGTQVMTSHVAQRLLTNYIFNQCPKLSVKNVILDSDLAKDFYENNFAFANALMSLVNRGTRNQMLLNLYAWGATGEKQLTAKAGDVYYDTTLGKLVTWTGVAWV